MGAPFASRQAPRSRDPLPIRHLTAADNVHVAGRLIDALAVRHGIIVAGRIAELGGPIDPTTHLNRDLPEHDLEQCAVAAQLVVGAAIEKTADGLRLVSAPDHAYVSRGQVDLQARLAAWRAALAERRAGR